MATNDAVRKVLATAAAEIGYSRWNDPKRGTKYARETQPVFWPKDKWLLANGVSFCDIGVTWVFWKALGIDFVNNGGLPAGASYNTDYRASHGGRVKHPKPGDVLVFDWNFKTLSTNHVGILEKILKSGNYQTIEFNTSPGSGGSQGNGGGVYRRVRRPSQVRYNIRPKWSKYGGSSSSSKPASSTKPWDRSKTISKLSKTEVKDIQTALKNRGYSLGSYGVDGSYGKDTYEAVRAFQKKAGLSVDGVAGPKTLDKLGYESKWKSPIKIKKLDLDGRFGHDTVTAAQLFLDSRGHDVGDIDGKAGHKFWTALGKYLGSSNTSGHVRNQSYKAEELGNGITQGWHYTGRRSKGDILVKDLQRWLGVRNDGILYEGTTRAFQKRLNVHKVGM